MKNNKLFYNCYKRKKNLKYSYYILKPNSVRNYNFIISEIENKFSIVNQYAILDYKKINSILHEKQKNVEKYLVPISKYYDDFYGNYAILVLIENKKTYYKDFYIEVYNLKMEIRKMLLKEYVSNVFDTSKLGAHNEGQILAILSAQNKELVDFDVCKKGTYMIFSPNEIHSPDPTWRDTINELDKLNSIGIFKEKNQIDLEMINKIKKYKTFEFLKDIK